MSKRFFPTDLLEQAASIQDAWSRIDAAMTFGSLNLTSLIKDINGLRGVENDLVSLENQLTALCNQRDALQRSTWDKLKRARAGIKAAYGDDSSEFEMIGGTRLSDRKSPRRSPASIQ